MIRHTWDRTAWQTARETHQQRVQFWINDRVERSLRNEKHPVYDFLFEYYTFRPSHLGRFSPGMGVLIQGVPAESLDWSTYYQPVDGGIAITADTFPVKRLPLVRWGVRFLEQTLERPPVWHCFGLHEWAMVYRAMKGRHEQVPLRLSSDEIARLVEENQLCCTHFDAYRFFTPEAKPLNRMQLNRLSLNDYDQPGCIHVNMDLYKWAFHLAPFISSELIADAFELAVAAREVDMRASPYDLKQFGFEPICIETKAGREEYVRNQRMISERGIPVRRRLLEAYRYIERGVTALTSQLSIQGATVFSTSINS
ncbi:MAG: 3-methyladenine DNA glycosylase [Planctomycetia bacterium]|nr:3-methyladenine DNA glycosylase [Planctomycetia bacterium]